MEGTTELMRNHTFWQTVANWIVPQSCALCRAPSHSLNLCEACMEELPWASESWISATDTAHPLLFRSDVLRGVIAPLRYEVPVDRFLQSFKYQGQTPWALTMAKWIEMCWPKEILWPDVWVPIPLHASRYRERGFNQSVLLARSLAKLRGGRVETQLLRRIHITPSAAQGKLTIHMRAQQVDHSFEAAKSKIRPQAVCLVDDVLTTGATLSAAAEVLKTAGIEHVMACVVARTL